MSDSRLGNTRDSHGRAETPDLGAVATNRSPGGGWDGVGTPMLGDFVRSRMGGEAWARVHIVAEQPALLRTSYAMRVACGRLLMTRHLLPANGDQPRQCLECWEAM